MRNQAHHSAFYEGWRGAHEREGWSGVVSTVETLSTTGIGMTVGGNVAAEQSTSQRAALPLIATQLGYAGLLPQLAADGVLAFAGDYWRFAALALAYAYAALIFSFLGGIWWGFAALSKGRAPRWTWVIAVLPSLVAVTSAVPWAIGAPWPGPSLVWLGLFILGSLAVDHKLTGLGLAPAGWMALRVPLTIGLGVLTLAAAFL